VIISSRFILFYSIKFNTIKKCIIGENVNVLSYWLKNKFLKCTIQLNIYAFLKESSSNKKGGMMSFFSKQTGTLVNYRQICFLYIWITIYKLEKVLLEWIVIIQKFTTKIEKGNKKTKDYGHLFLQCFSYIWETSFWLMEETTTFLKSLTNLYVSVTDINGKNVKCFW
jgi:hypothetical protein